MNESQTEAYRFLMEQHSQSCFEQGYHPEEIDTPYSIGADAIPRLTTTVNAPKTDTLAAQQAVIDDLVAALERIAHVSDIYGVEANAEDQGADTLAYAHKSTCNLARAAIASAKETT